MKKIEASGDADSRNRAAASHRAGDIAGALILYEAILAADPADAEIWGLVALARFHLGQEKPALTAWTKGLAREAPIPVRLRLLTNLLIAAQKQSSAAISDFLASLAIPAWPLDIPPGDSDKAMLIALARGLVTLGRKQEAARLLDGVLTRFAGDIAFVKAAIVILIDAGGAERAMLLLRPLTSQADPVDAGLLIAHAAAAHQAGHDREAQQLSLRTTNALPIHLTRQEPGQTLLVGILNRTPLIITDPVTPAVLHFSKNTPGSIAFKLNDQYRFLSIFAEANAAEQALASAPRPQIILNNWVNAEVLSTAQTLDFIAGFADRLDLPVLNHPRRAAETTRQRNAARLTGIPGLIVPDLIRFVHDRRTIARSVDVIALKCGFPVIIRAVFTQKGVDTVKIDTPAELAQHLAGTDDPQLYAIRYVHNPVTEGLYRKIRVAVIGDEIFITHVHFGQQWNVHRERGSKELAAVDGDGRHKAFADRIIARPQEALGASAWAALHEIARRTPLDLYGIDVDIMPDGSVLFFEVNAAMTLSMSDRPGLEDTRGRMRAALRRLFENPPSTEKIPSA
ncbi:MAG TPA: hypothetical protein VL101_11400 [Nordella sp.]|nr:hypothetical protein [Nordella sp.]